MRAVKITYIIAQGPARTADKKYKEKTTVQQETHQTKKKNTQKTTNKHKA
jgi:hypothetical protein